jgi:ACS family hexuronate transporter-like MFS transporter
VITTAVSALIFFSLAGFGYTAYLANALAYPADVVPKSAVASVWGLASVGAGLGGAIFQSLSGLTIKTFSTSHGYGYAYNILFIGFGVSCLIGLSIILFLMGPLVKNENLHEYVLKN